MVPSSELIANIKTVHPSATRDLEEPNETARTWKIPGFKGTFGFISSMSDHFCSSCNRLRLTADGQIKVSRHQQLSYFFADVSLNRFACSIQRKSL